MTEKESKPRGDYCKTDDIYSGERIDRFVNEEKNFTERSRLKRKIVESLGYKYNDDKAKYKYSSAYSRIKKSETFLGISGLTKVAKELNIDWFDILDDKYQDMISTIEIISFNNANNLNDHLYKIEKKHDFGRIGIFNKFPSLIYYPNNVEEREKRYIYLTESANKNDEYYSLRSILEFGFSPFSEFYIKDRVNILNNVINAHGATTHTVNIIDNTKVSYSRTSTECEIVGKDHILMQSPYYTNSLLSIRSRSLVRSLKYKLGNEKGIGNHMDGIHSHQRTMKFIRIMRDVINEGGDALKFISALQSEESALANSVESLFSQK
jgi:hypothetical protein